PAAPLRLRADGEPVAGEIDDDELLVDEEEVELACSTRRAAGACKPAPAKQRVQQRRLPDVRAACHGHFRQSRRRAAAGRGRGAEEPGRGDLHGPEPAQPPAWGAAAGCDSPSALFTIWTWRT